MKAYVVVVENEFVVNVSAFEESQEGNKAAETCFLEFCKQYVPEWETYTDEDEEYILDNGHISFCGGRGCGFISLCHY